ncbi:hypothetical protein L9F63_006154 [Diploptera punctata]|uniref:Uncharacterized protein n=1 Tax=Diploptera punctata TaxID=6984 RepID=A0AAD8E4U7_DIPPU|nr:hypothetical protein L9F63_006154 [Diploptera punctata]
MSKLEENVGFYRKMSDLQEKLRRSEEERLQLEEKFALLMRACRDEEEVRLNNLRERYETFLDEEKHRKERNDRILQTLDRIENRAAILTAKSERLKLLRVSKGNLSYAE